MEHVSIPDADRHEPRGASTAIVGQVLKSAGGGLTNFGFMSYTELLSKPVSVGYTAVLSGASVAASQQPVAVGTPLKVEFGPAQTLTDVSLSAVGNLTFNTAGQYLITLYFRYGRTSGAGDAYLFNRLLINGSQVLNSNAIRLGDQTAVIPFSAQVAFTVTAGQVFTTEILRDAAGVNNGGLFQLTPSLAGWAAAPSASITVSKFVGLV